MLTRRSVTQSFAIDFVGCILTAAMTDSVKNGVGNLRKHMVCPRSVVEPNRLALRTAPNYNVS